MDLQKIIPLLKTSKPLDIFKKVVAFNEEATDNGKRATVRLGLSSGFILEGIPLKMDNDGNVVFTSVNKSISYVNTQQIAGVEILNPDVLMDVLTGGSYFEVPQNGIPTSLELKRNFKAAADIINDAYGFSLESALLDGGLTTEAEKFQFQQFLKYLESTLESIAQEDIGKQALNDLQKMNIVTGNQGVAGKKNGKNLEIGVNFENKFTADFADKLKETLEINL